MLDYRDGFSICLLWLRTSCAEYGIWLVSNLVSKITQKSVHGFG